MSSVEPRATQIRIVTQPAPCGVRRLFISRPRDSAGLIGKQSFRRRLMKLFFVFIALIALFELLGGTEGIQEAMQAGARAAQEAGARAEEEELGCQTAREIHRSTRGTDSWERLCI
jgi:hypothetical protein